MANDGRITVTCPHCGTTGTYNTTIKASDGDSWPQCKQCHKKFRVKLVKGDVAAVMK